MKKETMLLEGLAPYNFGLTAHKLRYGYVFTPYEIYSCNTLWCGVHLDDMPVGLKIESIGSIDKPEFLTTIFTRESLSNDEIKTIVLNLEWVLQLKEDISEFYKMANKNPILEQCCYDLYGMRDTPFPDVFSGIITAVALQNTTWKRSSKMIMAVYREYGDSIVFDRHKIVLCPSAKKIAVCNIEKLRVSCRLGYRAKYVKEAAKTILEDFPDMAHLREMTEEEVKKKLMEIYGIGEYSAEIVTPHPSFPIDSWGKKIFTIVFGVKEDMRDYVTKEFGKWQGYVYAYILHNLDNLGNLSSLL